MNEAISMSGRNVEVKQLTMKQVKEFISGMDPETEPHIIDIVFDDPIPAGALSIATGLSLEELAGNFTQDEIKGLLDKAKAVNPYFVGMMERIIQASADQTVAQTAN